MQIPNVKNNVQVQFEQNAHIFTFKTTNPTLAKV